MTDDADLNPPPPRRITDRDLARLMRQGVEEAARDPAASELYERIRQRQNMEEDRDHRERSDRSAVLGMLVGLLLLAVFITGSVATFHR